MIIEKKSFFQKKLDIVYEDENIIVINKPVNMLSHASSKEDYGKNLVDYMIGYLIESGSYVPRAEKTFAPAIINRLDRNTSGLVIGAKNSISLRELNKFKERYINKFYKTIVYGIVKKDFIISEKLLKDEENNKTYISDFGKDSVTEVYVEKTSNEYSLLRIKLITGRTHQIRKHLSSKKFYIIGDIKYGNTRVNKYFKDKFNLNHQFLHAEEIIFGEIQGHLSYLSGKKLVANMSDDYIRIFNDIF